MEATQMGLRSSLQRQVKSRKRVTFVAQMLRRQQQRNCQRHKSSDCNDAPTMRVRFYLTRPLGGTVRRLVVEPPMNSIWSLKVDWHDLLPQLTCLRAIELAGSGWDMLTATQVRRLAHSVPALRHLSIQTTSVSTEQLEIWIRNSLQLRSVAFWYQTDITARLHVLLTMAKSLQHLELHYCSDKNDLALKDLVTTLHGLPCLRIVRLRHTRLSAVWSGGDGDGSGYGYGTGQQPHDAANDSLRTLQRHPGLEELQFSDDSNTTTMPLPATSILQFVLDTNRFRRELSAQQALQHRLMRKQQHDASYEALLGAVIVVVQDWWQSTHVNAVAAAPLSSAGVTAKRNAPGCGPDDASAPAKRPEIAAVESTTSSAEHTEDAANRQQVFDPILRLYMAGSNNR